MTRPYAYLFLLFLACSLPAAETTRNCRSCLPRSDPDRPRRCPRGNTGGVTVPPGVSLQGAGYGKTIIDADGKENGLMIASGSGAVISDLTVRGATGPTCW